MALSSTSMASTIERMRGFVRAEDDKPEPETHDVSGEGEENGTVDSDGGAVRNGKAAAACPNA
jgi:ParB family chromosome partitioning protein